MLRMKSVPHKLFLGIVAAHLLVFALAILFLLPTHDDWDYLASPQINGWSWTMLLPNGIYWRPWDALLGALLTKAPVLYPVLNHALVIVGHALAALLLWKLMRQVGIDRQAAMMSLVVFAVSPASLGTVLGIDSMNQCYACVLGLLSIWLYLKREKWGFAWLFVAWCATWAKENGIVYFLLAPAFGYIFYGKSRRLYQELGAGALLAALYMVLRLTLAADSLSVSEESPYGFTADKKLTDIVSFLAGTISVVDYISLLHAPSRNWTVVGITLLVSVAFLCNFMRPKTWGRQALSLAGCTLVAASPHLATHFGPMHAYSTLPWFCLTLAALLNGRPIQDKPYLKYSYVLYVLVAIAVDWHHWQKTYISSVVGPALAEQVIRQTGEDIPQDVYVITVVDAYPRYSSFCLPPRDVFFGGEVVRRATHYTWPKKLRKTNVSSLREAYTVAKSLKRGENQSVWIMNKDKVLVLDNPGR